jgi:hypothetical protein
VRTEVRQLAARVVGLSERADELGISARPLQQAVMRWTADPGARANLHVSAAGGVTERLASRLDGLGTSDLGRFADAVESFATGLDATVPVEVLTTAGGTGSTRMSWSGPESAERSTTGRIVLVGVQGAQVGEHNDQLNVFVQTVEHPKVDFRAALRSDPAVVEALEAFRADPADPDLRAAAVDALSDVPTCGAADWTNVFAVGGMRTVGPSSPSLDGTVAVVESHSVQVGDRNVQTNTIEHTVSPTVPAALLLIENPELVNSLIDLAANPEDQAAAVAFRGAVESALVGDLAASAVARSDGTVYRPPTAGRTLRISHAPGVSVGRRVSQKNQYLQRAHVGRKVTRIE